MHQARVTRRAELTRDRTAPVTAEERLGLGVRAGDRVFDRASGQYVEVIGGTRENVLVPAAKLAGG